MTEEPDLSASEPGAPTLDAWTIIAPGPSIARLDISSVPVDGPVVVVNSAALCGVRADFWAAQDTPRDMRQVWGGMSREDRARAPTVWCRQRFAMAWAALGFRVWPHPDFEEAFDERFGRVSALPVTDLTVTAAIARAAGLGARRVRVFGVDMAGEAYAFGESQIARDSSDWAERWRFERPRFAALEAGCRARGIEFVRSAPPTDTRG